MKLTVSGWPGSGSSSLSLILAKNLNLKLLRGGEIFRFLGKRMNFKETGEDRFKADKILEKEFGSIYDKFVDWLLLNNDYDNLLIETDIAALRLGKRQEFFSIFLHTDFSERKKRVVVDGRVADDEVLKQRDKANRDFYMDLYKVDWFDLGQLKDKYNLLIDNTKIPISTELEIVYENLVEKGLLMIEESKRLTANAILDDKNYWDNGKKVLENELSNLNLLYSTSEVLNLIVKNFTKEVEALPQSIREILTPSQ